MALKQKHCDFFNFRLIGEEDSKLKDCLFCILKTNLVLNCLTKKETTNLQIYAKIIFQLERGKSMVMVMKKKMHFINKVGKPE